MSLGILAVCGAAVTGCSFSIGNSKPTVTKDALQTDLTTKLTDAGATPKSVTCQDDLVGEVGKTSQCSLDLGPTQSIEALVKVSSVDGTTINYDVTPSVTQKQLEASVSALLSDAAPVDSVSCTAGLEPTVGTGTDCTVTSDGASTQREVTVDKVNGLLIDYSMLPILPVADVVASLTDQLEKQLGARPDPVECTDDLQGKPGATVDCTVTLGDQPQVFVLTVDSVDGTKVNYSYQPKS